MGGISFWRRNNLSGWLIPFLATLILDGIVILLHMQKHVLKLGWDCMDGLLLDNFKKFVVIPYGNMPAIDADMELFEAEAH